MCYRIILFVVFVLLNGLSAASNSSEDESRCGSSGTRNLKVCTTEGCLIGKLEEGNKRAYEAFYGVPYAAPPVEHLRFKKPKLPDQYEHLWDSTYHRSECMQHDYVTNEVEGNEDCLYLNIYRPKQMRKEFLPVLVFLHGGAFKFGTTHPRLYGPGYLMDTEDVILVTVQYRLGVFGFLSSGDKYSKGNFGLKDQNMALKWLQSNINSFGGDPDKVTLMGDSCGAASTHFHMMSEKSNGLFHKAIMIGGNALAYWALERDPQKQLRELAAIAGIFDANRAPTSDIVEILATMSAKTLQKYSMLMYQIHDVTPVFRPVIEGSWNSALVREDPLKVWEKGNYQHRPFLMTMATNEQAISADFYYDPKMRQRILDDFDNSLIAVGGISRHEIEPIKKYYFDNKPTHNNMYNFTIFQRDRWFFQPSYTLFKQYSRYQDHQRRNMDLLMFNFTSQFSMTKLYHPYTQTKDGPSKMDVLLYIFEFPALNKYFHKGPAEFAAKDLMVGLITKYVTEGLEHSPEYPVCTAEKIDKDGFCQYLLVQRQDNGVQLTTSDQYDLASVNVLADI